MMTKLLPEGGKNTSTGKENTDREDSCRQQSRGQTLRGQRKLPGGENSMVPVEQEQRSTRDLEEC